ncbi:MAG TPA: 2Fe-2S iron-sulfur cluster-binding protein [Kofleriaceae bacterium]|nr:2Fe-2S iron-sulfur cluster-binding protein [Kofleriaceae bacterium]
MIDPKFAKWLVLINGLVPAVVLGWDAYRGQLGVNDVNYAIRTTGMLSLVFLVLSLVITPLRRVTGWNQLIAVRRNLGLYGFFYAAAHFTIFFAFDRAGSVISTAEEIVERVYLWFGFGALVLMVPLAVTSMDSMVTRIGPRRWKLLHRLAYAVAIGGVVHYYLLVKADVRQPLAFAIVLGVLLFYRAVFHYLDLRRDLAVARAKAKSAAVAAAPKQRKFWSGELRVARIFDETHDVKTFRLISPDGGSLPFAHVAGQYLNLALEIDGKRVNRSYTIASPPTRAQYCEISVKRVGHASGHLHATLREGQTLKVSAPAGKFVFAGHEAQRVVLIAGGVGITPMMSVVRSLTDRCWTGEMYLLFSVKQRADIIFEGELAYLKRRFPNLHVLVTLTSDPDAAWDGARGQLTREVIEGFVPGLTSGPVLLCGPDGMMTAMRTLLVELGVPDAEIHQEAFLSPAAVAERPAGDAAAASADAAAALAAALEAGGGDGDVPNVRFLRAGKTVDLPAGLTVLEAAEEAGVDIPFECRSGICGQCKTRLVSGRVSMEVQDALTPADRSKGLILACQARAAGGLVVDA